MRIVETRAFTARIQRLLPDDEYRLLQLALGARPDSGDVIPRSGGLRKVRWGRPGMGRRGGLRLLYVWHPALDAILMVFVFAKNERDDLTAGELQQLRTVIEQEYP